MKKMMMFVAAGVTLFMAGQSLATSLTDYKFLKIAPQDQRAVVKKPDGDLQLVSVGDVIADAAEIVEIAEGRIVLEIHAGEQSETVIVRISNNRQRIEHYHKVAEPRPSLTVPVQVPAGETAVGQPSFTAKSKY